MTNIGNTTTTATTTTTTANTKEESLNVIRYFIRMKNTTTTTIIIKAKSKITISCLLGYKNKKKNMHKNRMAHTTCDRGQWALQIIAQ